MTVVPRLLGVLLLAVGLMAQDRQVSTLDTWDFAPETAIGAVPGDGWAAVRLPHIFRQSGVTDEGSGWYRRTLSVTAGDLQGRILLVLEGAATVADVWVGGVSVGRHVSPYTASAFDLTSALTVGSQELRLRVSNRPEETAGTLAHSTLYRINGGLFRGVRLIRTGAVHIHPEAGSTGVFLTPGSLTEAQGELRMRTVVRNPLPRPVTVVLRHEVSDPQGQPAATVETTATLEPSEIRSLNAQAMIASPQRWDLGQPRLYAVTTSVVVNGIVSDRVRERTGLRTVAWKDGAILLNGTPRQLYGVNNHAQDEDRRNAVDEEFLRAEWRRMMDLGLNTVRLAHYPHAKIETDLADEHGVAVWAENGFAGHIWKGALASDQKPTEVGLRLTREMVLQYWNHPSILFWSCGNETWVSTASVYAKAIRELDTSRIITFACGKPEACDMTTENTYDGWYGGTYRGFEALPRNALVSETGAGSWITHHQAWDRLHWSVNTFEPEEYAFLFAAIRLQTLANSSPTERPLFLWWLFRDFHDRKFKQFLNTKGLLTMAGEPKDLYYLFQAFWRKDLTVVRLAGRHHRLRRTAPDDGVVAIANAPKLELLINGVSHGWQTNGDYRIPDLQQPGKEGPITVPGSALHHVFRWRPTLAPGRHEVVVRDGAGHDDRMVIYQAPAQGLPTPAADGLVQDLVSSNPANPALHLDLPIAAQGPVFTPVDGTADTTFDRLPDDLQGATSVGTGRTGTPDGATALSFRVQRPAVIDVLLETGRFAPIEVLPTADDVATAAADLQQRLQQQGFVQVPGDLRWRDHGLRLVQVARWQRALAAGVRLEVPTLTVDAVVLVRPQP